MNFNYFNGHKMNIPISFKENIIELILKTNFLYNVMLCILFSILHIPFSLALILYFMKDLYLMIRIHQMFHPYENY